jgi:hypothetical protein
MGLIIEMTDGKGWSTYLQQNGKWSEDWHNAREFPDLSDAPRIAREFQAKIDSQNTKNLYEVLLVNINYFDNEVAS